MEVRIDGSALDNYLLQSGPVWMVQRSRIGCQCLQKVVDSAHRFSGLEESFRQVVKSEIHSSVRCHPDVRRKQSAEPVVGLHQGFFRGWHIRRRGSKGAATQRQQLARGSSRWPILLTQYEETARANPDTRSKTGKRRFEMQQSIPLTRRIERHTLVRTGRMETGGQGIRQNQIGEIFGGILPILKLEINSGSEHRVQAQPQDRRYFLG